MIRSSLIMVERGDIDGFQNFTADIAINFRDRKNRVVYVLTVDEK